MIIPTDKYLSGINCNGMGMLPPVEYSGEEDRLRGTSRNKVIVQSRLSAIL
jgi:hypothetical protein